VANAIKYLTLNKLDMFYRCEKCGEKLRKGMNFLLSIKGGFPTFNNQSFPFVYFQFMNAFGLEEDLTNRRSHI